MGPGCFKWLVIRIVAVFTLRMWDARILRGPGSGGSPLGGLKTAYVRTIAGDFRGPVFGAEFSGRIWSQAG